MTKATRRIGRNIPVSWQHGFRDGGGFRWLADSMVASLAIPFGSVTCPSAASDFVKLSRDFKQLRYGDHESQFIDVFLPDENHICDPALDAIKPPKTKTKTTPKAQARVRGMLLFIHGGAWGSGKPWFYRLVAKPFLEMGLAVAIVGYRVYPLCGIPQKNDADRGGVRTQVDDLEAALGKLTKEYPEWCNKNFEDRYVERKNQQQRTISKHPHHLPHLGTIVMGHSSGGHIAMLWMVEQAQKNISDIRRGQPKNLTDKRGTVDAFIGISGVYNIGHHFDYEGGRGVEEISPLKPANGYDRKTFAKNTPSWKIQHELIRTLNEMDQCTREQLLLSSTKPVASSYLHFPERFLLVHGAEDDIVPFTGTSEAARILKQCLGGGTSSSSIGDDCCNITIDECYIPQMGHQDTVVDLMMLGGQKGPVTRTVVEWLLNGNRQILAQKRSREKKFLSTIRSKL
jgi:acetyl esterase/lipase